MQKRGSFTNLIIEFQYLINLRINYNECHPYSSDFSYKFFIYLRLRVVTFLQLFLFNFFFNKKRKIVSNCSSNK